MDNSEIGRLSLKSGELEPLQKYKNVVYYQIENLLIF